MNLPNQDKTVEDHRCCCSHEHAEASKEAACCKETESTDRCEELVTTLKYLQAEFENYRKQTERRMEQFQKDATRRLILKVLPVVDNFELALKMLPPGDAAQGIELIHGQLKMVLENEGVTVIPQQEMFDPTVHQAIMKIENDAPENTVLEVVQSGYYLHGLVLRAARVKISTGRTTESVQNDISSSHQ